MSGKDASVRELGRWAEEQFRALYLQAMEWNHPPLGRWAQERLDELDAMAEAHHRARCEREPPDA